MISYVAKLNQPTYTSIYIDSHPNDDIISELNQNYISFGASSDSNTSSKKRKSESSTTSENENASKRSSRKNQATSKQPLSNVISEAAAQSVSDTVSKVLGKGIGNELGSFAGDIAAMGLDRGAAFLSGAATTALAASPAGYAIGAVGNTVEQLDGVTKLFDMCKDKLIDDITGIATSYISKLTMLPATATLKLTSYASYYLAYYTMMPADILKDLIDIGKFSLNTDMLKENLKGMAMAKANEAIGTTLSKINEKVSEKCEKVNSFITMLSAYQTEGVDWVMNQMNSYTVFITNEVGSYIGKGYQIVEDNVMQNIDKVGEVVGKGAAAVINTGIKLTVKKQLDQVEALKIFGMSIAKVKIKQAILKLKGLMGA